MSFRVALPGAQVLFSTREGGLSSGPYESLNLGLLTGDDRELVIGNRRRLAASAELEPEDVVMGWQVHGIDIKQWEGRDPESAFLDPQGGHLKVDGHLTTERGLAALVLVADCLPVAIAGGGAVAMLHCGWRGLAGGLIGKAAARMREGAAPTEGDPASADAVRCAAAVGPGIGACCYEVGDEVLEAFGDLGPGFASGRMLDLAEVARRLLERAGVERIEVAGLCTSCEPELFFSHRRDRGRTGRQAGLVWPERRE